MRNFAPKVIEKYFKVLQEFSTGYDGNNDVIFEPGQIVKMRFERNNCDEIYHRGKKEWFDVCFDSEELRKEYLEDFNIMSFEHKMTRRQFKIIFECSEDDMEHIDEDLYAGFYSSYYDIATMRMMDSYMDARGHYISKGLEPIYSDILDYILLHNKYSGEYTMEDWARDTHENYPEYLDCDFSDVDNAPEYIECIHEDFYD